MYTPTTLTHGLATNYSRSHIFRVSILCCVYICITLNTHECMYIDTAFLSSARFHGGYIRSYPCCVYICTNRSIDTPWCVPCRGKTWFFVDMVVLYPNSGVLYEGAKPCWRVGEDEIRVGQVRMDVFFETSRCMSHVLVGKVFNFKTACGLSKMTWLDDKMGWPIHVSSVFHQSLTATSPHGIQIWCVMDSLHIIVPVKHERNGHRLQIRLCNQPRSFVKDHGGCQMCVFKR